MNNPEPVLWMVVAKTGARETLCLYKPSDDYLADCDRWRPDNAPHRFVPLYAAPPAAIPTEVWASVDRLIDFVEERRSIHRDPDSADYNDCDKAECAWCQDTGEAIAALRKIKEEK